MADNIKQMKLDLANKIHSMSSSIGDNSLLYFHTEGGYEEFLNDDVNTMFDLLKKWKDIAKEKDNG
jgi:hypothetical protein